MKSRYLQENINPVVENLDLIKLSNLTDLVSFFQDPSSGTCLIQGSAGSFKTPLVRKIVDYLKPEVLCFRLKFFEGTTIDDIHLCLFEELKRFVQQKKLTISKIEATSLSQRINHYLNHISVPAVFIMDSVENIFDKTNQSEKDEILNFISHLNIMGKFKIVLVSNVLGNMFSPFLILKTITIDIFTQEETKEYFKKLNINLSDDENSRFYAISKGYSNLVFVTANILITLNTTIDVILEEYSARKVSYEEFVINKLINFVLEKDKPSLCKLAYLNIGVSSNFLVENNFFNTEQISYLVKKGILVDEYSYIFIKPNIKKIIKKNVTNYEQVKIHEYWSEFYNSQLPLSPSERSVMISRGTMRNQIEYHNSFLNNKKITKTEMTDVSLMSYLNSNMTDWNLKTLLSAAESNEDEIVDKKQRPQIPDSLKNKKENLEKYALTKDELALMSLPTTIQEHKQQKAQQMVDSAIQQNNEKASKNTLSSILSVAEDLYSIHSFDNAYSLYFSAFEMTDDVDYIKSLAGILEKLAICSKKLNKPTDAIDWYNRLVELFVAKNDIENLEKIRLDIALIYKETYKIEHARTIYEKLLDSKNDLIKASSYISLASLEDEQSNIEKAVELYKKSFEFVDSIQEKGIFAEAFFKYALILDEYHQTKKAFECYENCIKYADVTSVYLSSAHTNIAEIYKEKGEYKNALDSYKRALKIDIDLSNNEGSYYICKKIAELNETLNPQDVLDWLMRSLAAAKKTNDKLYISNAYSEIGEYYEKKGEQGKALKSYQLAQQTLAVANASSDEMFVVTSKINRLQNLKH